MNRVKTRAKLVTLPVGAGVVAAAAIISLALTGGQSHASSDTIPTFDLSSAQQVQALQLAHKVADESIPSGSGGPLSPAAAAANADASGGWPSNVTDVYLLGTTRASAEGLLDGSTAPDDRQVVIIRLTGNFLIYIPSAPGAPGTRSGNAMTVVQDAKTGDTLDFGIEPAGSVHDLPPQAKAAFIRN
jgi:hypothetical protein